MSCTIREELLESFRKSLVTDEKSNGTVEKYMHDVKAFAVWLCGREVNRENAVAWKEHLSEKGYAPRSVNSMLSAVNKFFVFAGCPECRLKFLRIQRQVFRASSRNLEKADYSRLYNTAVKKGNDRLALLMETICGTGIRVSEVKYITVEAARRGRADISLKGKIRTILLPSRLCRKLLKYAKKRRLSAGEIFVTRNRTGLSRRQIWQEMKNLCEDAEVETTRVFPHNLRHLFAVTFYRFNRDVVMLADLLGHSSIETTRIYLITTGEEHAKRLERLGLIM